VTLPSLALAFALGPATQAAPQPSRKFDAAAYTSPAFEGSGAQLREALRVHGTTRRVRRLGFSAPRVDRNCHTQAIAIARGHVLMSCVDRRNGVGWLQIFGREGDGARPSRRGRSVRLHDVDRPHPAVGQAVVAHGRQRGELLVPNGNESLDVHGTTSSRLELRDGSGTLVCAIDNPRPGGLAATALVTTQGSVHAIAVSYAELLVWRVDGVQPGTDVCDAELVFAAAGTDVAGDKWRRYQGIAALVARDRDVFLFAGRRHHLDAWKLSDFGESHMRVEAVGSMQWRPAAMPVRGIFHEGLGVEPHAGGLRIWAAPRDFRRGSCLPASADERCTPAVYYVDQPLAQPVLTSR